MFSGNFEYHEINGFYKPSEALKRCERDQACGGLTFKGTPLKFGTLGKMKYEVYFFHYVPEDVFEKNKTQYFHWTSYVADRKKRVLLRNLQLVERYSSFKTAVCLNQKR